MHTPIGVKPVAGSKSGGKRGKTGFAHISKLVIKHIYIAINSLRDISLVCPHQNLTLKEQVKLSECSLSYS